jgi:hypothetical protein
MGCINRNKNAVNNFLKITEEYLSSKTRSKKHIREKK